MITFEAAIDLTRSPWQTLVCPVNTNGVMGNGLAKWFQMRFPGLETGYRQALSNGELALGKCAIWPIPDSHQQVLLFASKQHWKNDSKIEYIESSLADLARRYQEMNIESLVIPTVGCGQGNLNYDDVRPLLYQYLDPISCFVIIALPGDKK